jgi:hypothetical protein
LLLCVLSCLTSSACSRYNPALYPSYDVLNPGAEVRLNPYGMTVQPEPSAAVAITWDQTAPPNRDGLLVVNVQFWQWTDELKQEVKRLRAELKKAQK